MFLYVLGSGNAFSTKYGNTQFWINNEKPENSLLFDCGETFLMNLERCKFNPSFIHNIFLSHSHSDHIGGISTLALMCYFFPNMKKKPNLFCKNTLMNKLWNNYLAITLETLSEEQLPKGKIKAEFEDFFTINPISENEMFTLGNVTYKPFKTIHVTNGLDMMDSHGLKFCTPKNSKNIVITSDIQFCPEHLKMIFERADYIFTECETSNVESGVHAHYTKWLTLSEEIRKKIYFTHYGDNIKEIESEFVSNFKGILYQGDIVDLETGEIIVGK